MATFMTKLKNELSASHPVTGAYDADNATAVSQINAVNIDVNKATMTGSEILNNINTSEWTALSAENKQLVWDIVHLGNINPFGIEATLMINAFGGGSQTITALNTARKATISRAEQLGLGTVSIDQVAYARAM